MEFNKENILNKSTTAKQAVAMDEGLRAYMLKVYNYMATGVLLTGIIALLSFKMSVVTDANGSIVALTEFGNAIFVRIKVGSNARTSCNSFLHEFWN
jgi:FtsH-binding integral membrane protein